MPTIAFALGLVLASSLPLAAVPPSSEGWLDDLADAQERARSESKPILVDLWADWCTWCKRLEENVYSTPLFREFAERWVLLRVDTEDGAEGTRLMQDFEVESLPTTLLVSHDLIKIGELAGYAPVEPYLQSLELEAAMYAALVRAYDDHAPAATAATTRAVADGAATAGGVATETLQTLADELHARRDGARAAVLYRELLARGADTAEDSAWNHFYYADSLRLERSFGAARAAAQAAREAASGIDNDELNERIDLLSYFLARDEHACADARREIDRFVEEHPDGVLLELARQEQRRMRKAESCA